MSRRGDVVLALLLALAVGVMSARMLAAAARPDPADVLRNPTSPRRVGWALLHGSPAQPGWQDAAAAFAGQGDLRVFLLLALSGEGVLDPVTRSWLARVAARAGSGSASKEEALEGWLAAFALERPADAGPR